MIKRKGYIKRGGVSLKPSRVVLKNASSSRLNAPRRKRRKKGELTKLKAELWLLCRLITKQKYGNTCYTCGRIVPDGKGMHTGHFLTSSLCSVELRYDLKNLRPQCYHCNINLSGNWPSYWVKVATEHGIDHIDELMTRNAATKGQTYPTQWFQDKIKEYQTTLSTITNT